MTALLYRIAIRNELLTLFVAVASGCPVVLSGTK